MPKTFPVFDAVYADGGLIKDSPSYIGGTWCYCWVNSENDRIRTESGVVTIEAARQYGLDSVTNNLTELLAIWRGIRGLPEGWGGTIYSDSLVTLERLFGSYNKWNGIPTVIRTEALSSVRRLGHVKVVLLDGHPSKKHLEAGSGKTGKPVSEHQKFCDVQCSKLAKEYYDEFSKDY